MRVNLSKIEKFYTSPLGSYVLKHIGPSINAMLEGAGQRQKACIASAASFPYAEMMTDMRRLSFQAFHDQDKWPEQGEGHFIIAERSHWPYRAEEADFVVLIHDLEFAEDPEVYLREAWRVLKGEGRLIVAVPNRSGKWARFDNTPFGLGYPYTLEQIDKVLTAAHFTIDKVEARLFHAPVIPQSVVGRLLSNLVERVGLYCLLQPGVYIICASKHIYAPTKGLGATAAEKAKQALFPKPTTTTRLQK